MLRHRLTVLRRRVPRPRYVPADRMVLAVLARWVPRERWSVFLVTLAMLLRWRRELAVRPWTYRHIVQNIHDGKCGTRYEECAQDRGDDRG